MHWNYILFDLDGTLFDTSEGIIHSLRSALEQCGEKCESDSEMYKFIGPPLIIALKEFYGMSAEKAERVKDVFRVFYREKGVFECKPIAGAEKCLRVLSEAGRTLAVATSKPDAFAKQILERHGFTRDFAAICGAESDAQKKSDVVRNALTALSLCEGAKNCVMVGDRKYDVEGAAACGIPCIGLKTGFAEEGEFARAGAIAVAEDYERLTQMLLLD